MQRGPGADATLPQRGARGQRGTPVDHPHRAPRDGPHRRQALHRFVHRVCGRSPQQDHAAVRHLGKQLHWRGVWRPASLAGRAQRHGPRDTLHYSSCPVSFPAGARPSPFARFAPWYEPASRPVCHSLRLIEREKLGAQDRPAEHRRCARRYAPVGTTSRSAQWLLGSSSRCAWRPDRHSQVVSAFHPSPTRTLSLTADSLLPCPGEWAASRRRVLRRRAAGTTSQPRSELRAGGSPAAGGAKPVRSPSSHVGRHVGGERKHRTTRSKMFSVSEICDLRVQDPPYIGQVKRGKT